MSTILHAPPQVGDQDAPHPGTKQGNPALRGPVLLAADGAGHSGAPVIAARLIAQHLGLPLEVVTVLEPQPLYGGALGGIPVYLPAIDEGRSMARKADVLEYVARFSNGGPVPPVHVRFGAIAEEIGEAARERGATLVIVGAAPHQRMNRIIAGERAVHVLHSIKTPVLSVPPGLASLPRNVLVAVDFSPASVRAAQAALMLLADGGTLTLLHLLSPLLGDAPVRDGEGRDPADAIATLFGRLIDELRAYIPPNVTIETMVRTANETEGILGAALSINADLIAVGTHGPRLLERVFLGSVSSSVLHAAPQSVLAAPPPSGGEALELWLRITQAASSTEPREWAVALDEFTRRNKGRRVAVEVDDPDIGAQMIGRGALFGVTYDAHDRRVEIMVGDAHRALRHLMHSIPNVESISMAIEERAGGEALELRHGRGHTLVLIG